MVSQGLMCTLQGSLVCQKMPTFKKCTRSLDNSFLRLLNPNKIHKIKTFKEIQTTKVIEL